MIIPKLKMVKPGKSIESTDMRDFVYNSDLPSIIVYMTELREVIVAASSTTKDTVYFKDINMENNQDLGFYPIVKISVELEPGSGEYFISPFTIDSTDGFSINIFQDSASDTGVQTDKFFVTFKNNTATQKTVKYRYRVYANIG
jgi:hypothetical protein